MSRVLAHLHLDKCITKTVDFYMCLYPHTRSSQVFTGFRPPNFAVHKTSKFDILLYFPTPRTHNQPPPNTFKHAPTHDLQFMLSRLLCGQRIGFFHTGHQAKPYKNWLKMTRHPLLYLHLI